LTSNGKRDAGYLDEFCAFGSAGFEKATSVLHEAFTAAHGAHDYDTAAHLQVRLHAEMVMAMETAAAHLYSYPRWNSSEGVLGTLAKYRSSAVNQFVDALLQAHDPIAMLKLPSPTALLPFVTDHALFENAYTDVQLSKEIHSSCAMLRKHLVRDAYNRFKHGALYVRHIDFLRKQPPPPEKVRGVVFLHRREEDLRFDQDHLVVTGEKGLLLAQKYAINVAAIMANARDLAQFVAFALENDLMRE